LVKKTSRFPFIKKWSGTFVSTKTVSGNRKKFHVTLFLLMMIVGERNRVFADFASEGCGASASDPCKITSPMQLREMGTTVNLDKYFVLKADIDLEGESWTPLAPSAPFTGTLDGNGHTISNLTIDTHGAGTNNVGLFANQATKNLAVFNDQSDISIWARSAVAQTAAAGIIQGLTEDTMAPAEHATRAQATVLLKRFLQYVKFMD
jgi:hypothetical protein